MIFPTLYKYNIKGKAIQWTIEVQEDKFRTLEGQVGGKITVSEYTICKPKNTGKKNETTGESQALKQAAAKFNKKKEKGFSETLEDSGESYYKPMLASEWDDYKELYQNKYIFAQPKLDGWRCLIYLKNNQIYMQSRSGKEIITCGWIKDHLKDFFSSHPDLILDGELYNHNESFETISGWIKNIKNKDISNGIQYYVYDVFGGEMGDKTFEERIKFLQSISWDGIVLTQTMKTNEDHLYLYERHVVSGGYEGVMIRDPKGLYEGKRSKGLVKLKRFKDEEFLIFDIEEGVGNSKGIAGRALMSSENGEVFPAGIIGSREYARDLFENKEKYIGKYGTVKFQEKTENGVPRFSKLKYIHE